MFGQNQATGVINDNPRFSSRNRDLEGGRYRTSRRWPRPWQGWRDKSRKKLGEPVTPAL